MWGAIISAGMQAIEGLGGLLAKRREHKTSVAVAKLKIQAGESLTAQQVQLARTVGMADSLKDEWWVVVLSLPWISMFLSAWWPELGEAAERMIGLVGKENYVWFLGGAIMASFGLRRMK